MGALTDKLLVLDGDALRCALQPIVAEAVADVVEAHAREVRELRRALFVLKGLLTAHEAGVVLGGVSADTVMGYVRERGLRCYRPGKAPLFRLPDLLAWAERFPEEFPDGSRERSAPVAAPFEGVGGDGGGARPGPASPPSGMSSTAAR